MIIFRLKEIAAAKGRNRHQLSLEAGVSYPTIDKYWRGDIASVDFAILDRLCALLDCEPGDLIVRVAD